jgi:hypothetical protein
MPQTVRVWFLRVEAVEMDNRFHVITDHWAFHVIKNMKANKFWINEQASCQLSSIFTMLQEIEHMFELISTGVKFWTRKTAAKHSSTQVTVLIQCRNTQSYAKCAR